MNRIAPWAAVVLAAVLVSGCSAALPNAAETATPTVSTPSPTPTRAVGDLGDVVCFEQVTDEYGEYCRTTISPETDAFDFDASVVDSAALTRLGFSKDDVIEALPVAMWDLVEDVMDSPRLDNYTGSERDWYKRNIRYPSKEFKAVVLSRLTARDQLWYGGFLATGFLPEGFRRDGSARAAGGTTIEVTGVTAGTDRKGRENLIFNVSATSSFPLSDFSIVTRFTALNPDRTRQDLRESDPQLFDGTNDNSVRLVADGYIGFLPGKFDVVAGHAFTFDFTTDKGTSLLAP